MTSAFGRPPSTNRSGFAQKNPSAIAAESPTISAITIKGHGTRFVFLARSEAFRDLLPGDLVFRGKVKWIASNYAARSPSF